MLTAFYLYLHARNNVNIVFLVFNDGQDKEMLYLEGTIPVPYKGTFHSPVQGCVLLLTLLMMTILGSY